MKHSIRFSILAVAFAISACGSDKNSATSNPPASSQKNDKSAGSSEYPLNQLDPASGTENNYPFNGEGFIKMSGDEVREIALSPSQGDAVFCYIKDQHFNLVVMTNLSKNLRDLKFEQALLLGFHLDSSRQIPKALSFPKLTRKDPNLPVMDLVGAPGSYHASYGAWSEPCLVQFVMRNDSLLHINFECNLNGVTSAEATKKVVRAKADITCRLEDRSAAR